MRKLFLRVSYFTLLIILLTSCVTARKINYMQKPGMNIPSYNDSLSYEEYQLKKNDRLYIKVYSINDRMNQLYNGNNPNQQTFGLQQTGGSYSELFTYLIEEDGNIVLPVVGRFSVEGKTVREAKCELEEELDPIFLTKVDVDIRIVGRYYSIIGQSTSGRFPLLKEKMNIFQALAQAGDIGLYGNKSKIRVLRETQYGTQIKEFDVRSADIIHSDFFYIEPNDVIYIQNRTDEVFGITNFTSMIGLFMTTISFGLFIYNLTLLCK